MEPVVEWTSPVASARFGLDFTEQGAAAAGAHPVRKEAPFLSNNLNPQDRGSAWRLGVVGGCADRVHTCRAEGGC